VTTKAKYLIVGVDDNFRVRESLTSLVESAGYCASMFGSAQDFLFSADVADADCVVI
jgi:FixJ family two-component response regulator